MLPLSESRGRLRAVVRGRGLRAARRSSPWSRSAARPAEPGLQLPLLPRHPAPVPFGIRSGATYGKAHEADEASTRPPQPAEVDGSHLARGDVRGAAQLAMHVRAGLHEAEGLRHAVVGGVPRGEVEDMVGRPEAVDAGHVPVQEALVEGPEGLHGGPLLALGHLRVEAARRGCRPAGLPHPKGVVAGACELLDLLAGACRHGRDAAVALEARCHRQGAAALVGGARVQGERGVEVGVEVEGEGEALAVGAARIPEEARDERLARALQEGLPV
mmetsp:Transcript_79631/g.257953  ORF Transcript_79631/g.257953 Transcript_79631/m.257953 type:complete len:273 (+) Transcript_79631:170-988(+)